MNTLQEILYQARYVLSLALFTLGETPVTIRTILYLVVLLILLFYLSAISSSSLASS